MIQSGKLHLFTLYSINDNPSMVPITVMLYSTSLLNLLWKLCKAIGKWQMAIPSEEVFHYDSSSLNYKLPILQNEDMEYSNGCLLICSNQVIHLPNSESGFSL